MTITKRHLLSMILSLLLLFPFFLIESYTENSLPEGVDRRVAADKIFIIRFNDIISLHNLNPESILVTDGQLNLPLRFENGSDGRSLLILPPSEGYVPGKIYSMIIQDLKNDNGKTLKHRVEMRFIVEEAQEEVLQEQPSPIPEPPSSPAPFPMQPNSPSPAPPAPSAPVIPAPVLPAPPADANSDHANLPENSVSKEETSEDSMEGEKTEEPAVDKKDSETAAPQPEQKNEEPLTENPPSDSRPDTPTATENAVPALPEKQTFPKPKPRPRPSSPPLTAEGVLSSLTNGPNKNAVQYKINENTDREEIRTVLWVKGIQGPEISSFKEVRDGDFLVYQIDYQSGQGWYDINKSKDGSDIPDEYLCFAAVAGNMLHWWFDQNKEQIDIYLAQQRQFALDPSDNRQLSQQKITLLESLRDSFRSQQDSGIFRKFIKDFGHIKNGFHADVLVDMLINGYTPKEAPEKGSGPPVNDDEYAPNLENLAKNIDSRGGLFYPAFGGKKLTYRISSSQSYNDLEAQVKYYMKQGGMIGLVYNIMNRPTAHIVTIWGAEFDSGGRLVAFYLSDSDDQNEGTNVGMKRLEVRNVDGRSKLGSNQNNLASGALIDHLHIMLPGEDLWQKYFEQNKRPAETL